MTDTGAFDWQVEDETGGKVVRAERQGKEPTLVRAGPVLRARSRWTSTSWPRLAAVVGASGAGGDQPRQQLGRLQMSLGCGGVCGSRHGDEFDGELLPAPRATPRACNGWVLEDFKWARFSRSAGA